MGVDDYAPNWHYYAITTQLQITDNLLVTC